MDNFYWLLGSIFGGTFFGSFLGPLCLEEWRSARRRKQWVAPRERALREIFERIDAPVVAIQDLARACGCTDVETRDLLLNLGARGTTMTNGMEGWYIDPQRMEFSHNNIDSK